MPNIRQVTGGSFTNSAVMVMNIDEIVIRLEGVYGRAQRRPPASCLETLIACILSQHTSDSNSHRAYTALRERFPCWADLALADATSIAETIRMGGLANVKARTIKDVLEEVHRREGDYSLEHLHGLATEEARSYLLSLPGVGPKTAAIVLCFAMGRPVLPVDTHVYRVSQRLGLLRRRVSAEKAHEELQAVVPADLVYRFHVVLIRHGRAVCTAQRPRCYDCPLNRLCPSANALPTGPL